MVELVDSVDLGSTAKSVQVRVLLPAPRKMSPSGLFFLGRKSNGTRTHFNGLLRWSSLKFRLDGICIFIMLLFILRHLLFGKCLFAVKYTDIGKSSQGERRQDGGRSGNGIYAGNVFVYRTYILF